MKELGVLIPIDQPSFPIMDMEFFNVSLIRLDLISDDVLMCSNMLIVWLEDQRGTNFNELYLEIVSFDRTIHLVSFPKLL